MKISTKIVADSISNNTRLTTLELCYPRFIHSEFLTHRMFSRNASSSRAIPIEKMIASVEAAPAMPIHWGKNQPGMQAREEVEVKNLAQYDWALAIQSAVKKAATLNSLGLHKQIVNRVLEPFQWIKVIVTATEWDNFFVLRLPYEELNDKQRAIADSWKERFNDHPDGKDAQPEIQELARCMKKTMEESTPVELKPGEWHLPYVTNENFTHMMVKEYSLKDAIKCSVARCARVSYNNHDNSSPDIEKDVALADRLLEAGHMSPFEHQATPMHTTSTSKSSYDRHWEEGITHMSRDGEFWSGNFRGFLQNRQMSKGK